jgi:hypothetical protein
MGADPQQTQVVSTNRRALIAAACNMRALADLLGRGELTATTAGTTAATQAYSSDLLRKARRQLGDLGDLCAADEVLVYARASVAQRLLILEGPPSVETLTTVLAMLDDGYLAQRPDGTTKAATGEAHYLDAVGAAFVQDLNPRTALGASCSRQDGFVSKGGPPPATP